MDKELFIKSILAVQSQMNYDTLVSEKLGEAFPGCYSANLLPDNHWLCDILIELLKASTQDKGNWIDYFCWELNFGEENYRLKVYDKKEQEIPLSTPDELWALLMSDNN